MSKEEKQIEAVYINTDTSIKVSEDVFWKPLRSYFYYLVCRVFKRLSTYVTIILGLGLSLFIAVLPIFFEATIRSGVVPMTLTFLSLFVIIFAGTLGVSKSLNIFTDFETDGSELLVISKSISRTQIIITKFTFLLIVGLLFAGGIAAMIAIGITIVGWDVFSGVDAGAVIYGSFIGSLISYCFMGMMSVAIGIKVSGKLARALPSAILSFSSIIAMIGLSLLSILAPNPPVDFAGKLTNQINAELTAKAAANDPIKVDTNEVSAVRITTTTYYSDLVYYYSETAGDIFYLSQYVYFFKNNPVPQTYSISSTDTNTNALNAFMTAQTANFLNKNPIGPTAAVAINFINPISAFAAISGSSVTASFNANTQTMPYNQSFSDYAVSSEPIIINKLSGGHTSQTTINFSIKAASSFQWDQNWIIGLTWGAIFVILSGFTIAAYFRKDFK